MLLSSPEQTIRLFIADTNHQLYKNKKETYGNSNMSVAFHPHHCSVTLDVIKGTLFNWTVIPSDYNPDVSATKWKYHSAIKEDKIQFEEIGKEALLTTAYQCLSEGELIIMPADKIHTVACEKNELTAWFVYEGKEDKDYTSFCWSNNDLNKEDFSALYKKPMKHQVIHLFEKIELI